MPPPVVLGTGLVALDVILSADSSRSPLLAAGGTCGNVLSTLSYLGWDAYPIARLNGETASDVVRRDLARWGVSLRFAEQHPVAPTPVFVQTIRLDRKGQPIHKFSTNCPLCGTWLPSFRPVTAISAQSVLEELTASADLSPRVFFFDRASRSSIILARALANQGALVVFEPAGVGEPRLFREAIEVAHVLKYSNERVTGIADSTLERPNLLLEIETRGSAGLTYRQWENGAREWRHMAAISAPRVADTAGAGDWCTAAFLLQVGSRGHEGVRSATRSEIEDALRFGQAAAAVACGYEGARGAMLALDRAEFLERVQSLSSGISPSAEFSDKGRPPSQAALTTPAEYACTSCSAS